MGRREGGFGWRLLAVAAAFAWACGDDSVGSDTGVGPDPCWVDGSVIDCSHLSSPCHLGACDPATGECVVVTLEDGPCDDGDPCTERGVCDMGTCMSLPRDCSVNDTECASFTCDSDMGGCVPTPVTDGTACDDESVCTTGTECREGVCTPTEYLDCSASSDVCNSATCDPVMGCVGHPLVSTPCDDGDACTEGDRCDAMGACVGTSLGCASRAGPCMSGTCDPATGGCVFSPAPPGTSCDDGNACTAGDTCSATGCAGVAVACTGADECHVASCDPAMGCVVTERPDGSHCDDGDRCTAGDQCTGGACAGTPLMCSALDDACNTGTCDPARGVCRRVPRADGTDCDMDANDCEVEACAAGACVPRDRTDCSACGAAGSGLLCRSGLCEMDPITEVEGFEGTGMPAAYTTSPVTGWAQTSTMSIEGAQAMRSGVIGDGQRSSVSRTVFSTGYTSVAFAFRTSSEAAVGAQAGDALLLLVDSVEVWRASGVRPWGHYEYDLWQPGVHVVTWRYQKDAAGTAGADAAFVDDVRISGMASMSEDFEAGGLPSGFTAGGARPWRVASLGAADTIHGARGVRSGAITHSQSSWLRYTVTNERGAEISYSARTETEVNDALVVRIDGIEVTRLSGNQRWFQWRHPLTAGTHTIEWRFVRDASLGGLTNTVWIDNVFVLPDSCP